MSAIVPGGAGRWRVTVNGLPHSWIPFEGIHTLLGAVPALIHPAPVEIAVIGLGLGRDGLGRRLPAGDAPLRVFEIAASQPGSSRRSRAVAPFASLVELLSDPRVHDRGGGRPAGARRDERPLRHHPGGRALPHQRGQRQPVLGRVLPPVREPPQAGRARLHAEAEPPRRPDLRRGDALRARLRQHRGGQQRPAPDRPRRLGGAARPSGGGAALRRGDARGRSGPGSHEALPARRNPGARVGLNRDLFPRDEFGTPARQPD